MTRRGDEELLALILDPLDDVPVLALDVQGNIVRWSAGASAVLGYDAADALLKKAKWNVKAAVVMQKTGVPYEKAVSRVRKADGQLREALGEDIEAHLRKLLGPAAH